MNATMFNPPRNLPFDIGDRVRIRNASSSNGANTEGIVTKITMHMTTLDSGYRCRHKFIDLVRRAGAADNTPRRNSGNRPAHVPSGTDKTTDETADETTDEKTDEANTPTYEDLYREVTSSRTDITELNNKVDIANNKVDIANNKIDNLTLQIERMCELLNCN